MDEIDALLNEMADRALAAGAIAVRPDRARTRRVLTLPNGEEIMVGVVDDDLIIWAPTDADANDGRLWRGFDLLNPTSLDDATDYVRRIVSRNS